MACLEDDFIVVLPSTSNLASRPDNRPDDYTVRLRRTYDLQQGDWEMAVLSVQYPNNWYNIAQDVAVKYSYLPELPSPKPANSHEACEKLKKFIRLNTAGTLPGAQLQHLVMTSSVVPRGQYATVQDLGDKICEPFNETRRALNSTATLSFTYDVETQRGRFDLSSGAVVIIFESAYIPWNLGFESTEVNVSDLVFSGPWPARKAHTIGMLGTKPAKLPTIDSIYVYSDIAKFQAVGDTEAPLLGIVPVAGACGRRQHWTFNPLMYMGVTQSRLSEIRIMLRTEQGARVPFPPDSTSVVCCLHFRRRKSAI